MNNDVDFGLSATNVIRYLPERTPGDERTCARCLGPVGRTAYFDGHFYCGDCTAHADDFPWRTTHGGLAP